MAECVEFKTCDMCHSRTNTSEDTLIFGDWMHHNGITVHYFCLLLSTNLPQNGRDCSGILGFLMKDIRAEIRKAAKRTCCYCAKPQATISCHTCKKFFHIVCGHRYDCIFIFDNDFRSYCHECMPPLDDVQKAFKKKSLDGIRCHMCTDPMGTYNPITMIYAKCCGNGLVHRMCMRKYALAAGYYLCCIWCRSKEFRNHVRSLGVFVPDRDAEWEKEKSAYASLHRGHNSCNVDVCHCPRGRDYSMGKWKLILCSLCGSYGAHNPKCIPGHENQKELVESFKCPTCCATEVSVLNQSVAHPQEPHRNESVNTGLHMVKIPNNTSAQDIHETLDFSSDETISSISTGITVRRRSSMLDINNSYAGCSKQQETISKASNESPENVSSTLQLIPPINTSDVQNITSNNEEEDIMEIENCPENVSSTLQQIPPINTPDVQNVTSNNDHLRSSSEDDDEEDIMEIENCPDFDEDFNCIGSCTVVINLKSPRFIGKTLKEICDAPELLTDKDKINRNSDRGIFDEIDKIIEKVNSGYYD